jgi:hypothetical protein
MFAVSTFARTVAVRYLGIEVDDALAIAEQLDIWTTVAERAISALNKRLRAEIRTHAPQQRAIPCAYCHFG